MGSSITATVPRPFGAGSHLSLSQVVRANRVFVLIEIQMHRSVCSKEENLFRFKLLGNCGLRVSELCLGTMTFGEGWGAGKEECKQILDRFVETT